MPGKSDFEVRVNIALEAARDTIAVNDAIAGRNGFLETIQLTLMDFGDAATDTFIAGKAGFRGRVLAIRGYDVTETFDIDNNDAIISIGTTASQSPASDIDYYAKSATTGLDNATSGAPPLMTSLGTFSRIIPAATGFNINKSLGSTTGSLAGICTIAVTIAWMAVES